MNLVVIIGGKDMDWSREILERFDWNGQISNIEQKKQVAEKLAMMAKDGDVISFGSGSTSLLAVHAIADRIKNDNLSIVAIPTSQEINLKCQYLGIQASTLLKHKCDWGFDGADEIDSNGSLIKGRGGAMFREKLSMKNSIKTYILVDESKFVDRLGSKFAVPVEVYPEALYYVKQELFKLGAKTIDIRLAIGKDGPIITENGNFILDAKFDEIGLDMESKIKEIVGVIESGLFIGYNIEVIKP